MSAAVRRRSTGSAMGQTAHDERFAFRAIKTEPLHPTDCQHHRNRDTGDCSLRWSERIAIYPSSCVADTHPYLAVHARGATEKEVERRKGQRQLAWLTVPITNDPPSGQH